MNRWFIVVIVSGLVIGFVGVLTHNVPATGVGLLLSLGGLVLAAQVL